MTNAELEFRQTLVRSEHPGWSATQVFKAAAGQARGGFARAPVVINGRSPVREADKVVTTVRASESDAVVRAIQAEHPEWSVAQCEKHAWETVWT
jgi:predicted metalloprotease with PDZ domain